MRTCAMHRAALMRRLPDGLILLSGGRETPRNSDVCYVFRQGSDFLYLTGVEDPDYHLLLDPKRRTSTLLIPRVDNLHRVWRGDVPGPAQTRRTFQVQRTAYADTLPALLKKKRRGYRKIYANAPALVHFKKSLTGLENMSASLKDMLEELRAVKTPGEIHLLAAANTVSGAAHRALMRAVRPGMGENEVQALFEAECLRRGLKHLAYPSIVAGGTNGAVLHYDKNNARLRSGDLLLVDAGAEVRGYAADITRTFPIASTFTRKQRDIYSIVLETQKASIRLSRPGTTTTELHSRSMRMIAEGLRDLRLLRGEVDGLVENGTVRLFYPHGIGHMLGLDVHDVNGGKRRRLARPGKFKTRNCIRLEPGFVITCEPGIYFIRALLTDRALRRKHRKSVDFSRADRFLDFGGIRIEDDILIRPSGSPRNLTAVPKELGDIEALRRER